MMRTKTMREIEEKMDHLDPESLRFRVLEAVKKFKGNWLELGRFVSVVEKSQTFREWGFVTFESYCTRELKLRQQTVSKLLRSFLFLKREEPASLSTFLEDGDGAGRLPDYESVNVLRLARAKKDISEKDYRKLRSAVFDGDVQPREVGRQYRSMLQSARADGVDPEEAWLRKRRELLKKVLGSLRSVKNTLELSQLLPAAGIATLKKLIEQVEEELTRE
ncbi:MAG: hypothetical protein RAO92_06000 [Candidatus Euphemobacter frigidus]|nr:hypothetical protein [Candidatus Euphemobacter frigidus]MDP8275937.1 hypothetical protein [Candidatus Euphemobacter frigidus]